MPLLTPTLQNILRSLDTTMIKLNRNNTGRNISSGSEYATADTNFAEYPQEFGYNYDKTQQKQYR